MKKGLIFATTLAMALGVGAAVGAHQNKAVRVKATPTVKIAGNFTNPTWADGAISMSLSGDYYTYTRDFAVDDEFKVVINSDWVSANWNGVHNETNGGVVDGLGSDHNFKVHTADKYTVKVVSNIEDYGEKGYGVYIEKYVAPDVPASDGYYIVGTKSNWKYAGATKMDAGTDGNKAQLLSYEASAGEIFKVRSYLNGVDTWYGSNIEIDASKLLDIYLNGSSEVSWSETAPASEGYYMQCTVNGEEHWGYFNGYKMVNTKFRGNVAYYRSFYLYANDELRVRSYYTDREPKEQWATVDNDTQTWGEPSGDNFKCKTTGYYDIYAFYESSVFKFYVAQHVDTFEVTIEAHLYEGSTFIDATYLDKQLAYVGEVDFMPEREAVEGYAFDGFYVDSNYQTAYTAHEITGSTKIYAKYMRLGYYVVGDEAFAGTGKGWCMDGAVYLPAATNDTENNMLEGAITIPEPEPGKTIKVRPAEIVENENGEAVLSYNIPYSLAEYSYAHKVGDNIEFSKGGTFAVYVNKSLVVYLNEGLAAFLTKFLTDTGNVCKTDNTTNFANLKNVWTDLANTYNSLDATTEKSVVEAAKETGDEKGTDLQKVVARYLYIIHRYGTVGEDGLTDFIWGETILANSLVHNDVFSTNDSNNLAILVIAISATIAAGVLLIILKKKRHQ